MEYLVARRKRYTVITV